jgi:protease YdgD
VTGRAADASARPLLRHDCTATSGTSGAPVLEQSSNNVWRVIGINVAGNSGQIGGVSVPVETLRRLLQSSAR